MKPSLSRHRYVAIASLLLICSTLLVLSPSLQAQPFSRADSLRGGLSLLRSCYDVHYYELEVKVDPKLKRIAGSNTIHFTAIENFTQLQLDLFAELEIVRITFEGKTLSYEREFNAVFVKFPKKLKRGKRYQIQVLYGGSPVVAKNPPWEGGFIWKKDDRGRDWIGVACEGLGASAWWPLKDHLSDEPDSMSTSIIVPRELRAISNGVLIAEDPLPGNFMRYQWKVHYPINSYNVSLYIGDYVHFHELIPYSEGELPLDYYVLAGNESVAKEHFKQVPPMLEAFMHYLGPYPFPKDGYALVETSYWGMEHQSAIAYGNQFQNNTFGFDYIIVHESGHEWFGNSLSVTDHAEMWIHESFTTYMESLYVEYTQDQARAQEWLDKMRPYIRNRQPMLGPLSVNYDGWEGTDIYYKGAWVLHSLRNWVQDDSLWFQSLKNFSLDFRHQTLTTEQVVQYFSQALDKDLSAFFTQFLQHPELPTLVYRTQRKKKNLILEYRWDSPVQSFDMPVEILLNAKRQRIYPSSEWQEISVKGGNPDKLSFDTQVFLYERQVLE